MKDMFEFNHIDRSLSESDIKTLKDFYSHYHNDDVFTISGISLVAIGTIAGGITLNPAILGIINGAGIIVAGIGKKKISRETLKCQG